VSRGQPLFSAWSLEEMWPRLIRCGLSVNTHRNSDRVVSSDRRVDLWLVGTVIWGPGELAFHPGSGAGSVSIVEFTAPTTSYYNIASTWQTDETTGPASPNRAAYGINGVLGGTAPIGQAFHDHVNGSGKFLLHAGDTFDFMIYATNYGYHTTGIAATVTAVPEPSSFALVGLGGLGLALSAYRRRCANAA
jgi:hypothetical protein